MVVLIEHNSAFKSSMQLLVSRVRTQMSSVYKLQLSVALSTPRCCKKCESYRRCFQCRCIAIPQVANSYMFFSCTLIDRDIRARVSEPDERVNDEVFRSPPAGWETSQKQERVLARVVG